MRTKEIKLYQLNELSEEIQKKVLERFTSDDSFMLDDWYEPIIEEFKQEMQTDYGCNVDEVYFSGFCSQGDGASFIGNVGIKDYLTATGLKTKYKSLSKYIEEYSPQVVITHSGHYSHEYCMNFEDEYFNEGTEKQTNLLYSILDDISDTFRNEAKKLYKKLEDEYEYLMSE